MREWTDIKGEDALDTLADMIEPATAILADSEVANALKSGKPVIKVAKYILKNHKKEIIEILAAKEAMPPDEYIELCNVLTLPVEIIKLLNNKELTDFFTLSVQSDATSFGDTTEITMASGI